MTKFRFILVIALFTSAPALAAKTLTFTTPAAKPLSYGNNLGFIDKVVAHALNRMGYKLQVSHLPAERALINANAGIDDGDLNRIGGLSRIYPNLIQASEPTFTMYFGAFSNKALIRTNNWDTIKPYSVGLVTGWKILERKIPPGTHVTKVRDPRQLFYLLQKHRIDIALFGEYQGLEYLKEHNIKGIRFLTPPLESRDMYVYFHSKHKDLVPVFDKNLKQMKKDGSWQRIYDSTLKSLTHN